MDRFPTFGEAWRSLTEDELGTLGEIAGRQAERFETEADLHHEDLAEQLDR